jgi:hypothetical protein
MKCETKIVAAGILITSLNSKQQPWCSPNETCVLQVQNTAVGTVFLEIVLFVKMLK